MSEYNRENHHDEHHDENERLREELREAKRNAYPRHGQKLEAAVETANATLRQADAARIRAEDESERLQGELNRAVAKALALADEVERLREELNEQRIADLRDNVRYRRIEEAARAVFQNPLDIDAMLELGEALSTEEVIAEDISP